MNLRVTANRRTGVRYRIIGDNVIKDPDFYGATITAAGQANYNPFRSLTSSFRMTMDRDYARPHKWRGIEIGTETGRNHTFQANYKVPTKLWLIGALQPDVNLNTSYREDSGPNVARLGDPSDVRNASNTRNASVKMNLDIGKYLKGIFDAVGLGEEEEAEQSTPAKTPPEGGEADTTAVEEPEKSGVDPWIAVKRVGGVLSRIRRINASFSNRFGSNYSRIAPRPGLLYQFGMTDKVTGKLPGQVVEGPERSTSTNSLVLDSGVQITTTIGMSIRYSLTLSANRFRATETNTKNSIWPDVSVNWSGLEKYGPLRGLFASSSATIGYKQTTRQTGQGQRVDVTDERRQITPSLVFAWKNGLTTNLSLGLTKNTNDTRGSFSETTSMSVNSEFKYAFAAGKALRLPLPFLRNKKLRSSLNTSLKIAYTRTGGRRTLLGLSAPQETPKTTTIRVAPRATYNFSNALNGGLFVDYSRRFSEATDQTITTVRVGIDATFTF
jgi:hypothetical protein